MNAVSNAIRAARHAAGMTVMEAAVASGATSAYIYRVEEGRSVPSVTTAIKLADAYGCSLDKLVGRDDHGRD